jgi:hypothetical protein
MSVFHKDPSPTSTPIVIFQDGYDFYINDFPKLSMVMARLPIRSSIDHNTSCTFFRSCTGMVSFSLVLSLVPLALPVLWGTLARHF